MPREVMQSDKWTSGDFQLISSDGVVFKIDGFYLFAASAVFRDGRSHNSVPEIEFTDETFEASATIDHFLTFITTDKLLNLLMFLTKYDRAPWRELFFRYTLKLHADKKLHSLTLFLIGAQADDIETCTAALDSRGSVWSPGVKFGQRSFGGHNMTDPRRMPLKWYRKIPHDYLYALTQAWESDSNEGRQVASDFKALIEAVKRE